MESDMLPLYPQVYPQAKMENKMDNSEKAPLALQSTSSPVVSQEGPHSSPMILLGPNNTVTMCPFCQAHVKTSTKHTVTTRTHITAVLCGFICCCCCLPYCMTSARNADHYCPNCKKYLGTYKK